MDPKEIILPKNQRQPCELILEEPAKKWDLAKVFGNSNPVELEIGIGKGLFMQECGLSYPDRNFIGIEYARKYLNKAIQRIEKRPIKNVRLIHGEAQVFIDEYLEDQSLHAVHLYFPDPWPKKRHHKRRLFQDVFIESVYRKLVPGGDLLIATDHQDYWEWMCEVLEKQTLLVKSEKLPQPPREESGLTNYEIKYIQEGRPIYRVGYQKP